MNREIIVVLDNVRSALNVGAIFRTCDAVGVAKLILCGITPYPPHPKVVKTALGAQEYVPYEHVADINRLIKSLQSDDYTILSVEQTENSVMYQTVNYPKKVALIFGNEITGVQKEFLDNSNKHIELPMVGKKESLNVATTAGIVLYHIGFVA